MAMRINSNHSHTGSVLQQVLSALKWLALIVILVTGSITYHLVSTHSPSKFSSSQLMDLPRELCQNVAPPALARSSPLLPVSSPLSSCQAEYQRVSFNRTKGLTELDLEQSRSLIGNRHRLALLSKKLQDRKQPVKAVVCGGSISMGHGVVPKTLRYSDRLEAWMNEYFTSSGSQKHTVYNYASHGADICAMAKRINSMLHNLPPNPDLFVLEFAVNDYQGQDHKMHLDHKTDVFFEGFEQLVVCAEIVVHRLLSEFPNAALVFLEFQTAIRNRKTAAALHMAVAKHYEVPVVSYAETFFPDFYRLVHKLKDYNYSTPTISSNSPSTADPIFPYPHGCVQCLDGYIDEQFRDKGCKSLCIFVQRSGNHKLKCDNPPPGREPCYVTFLAHDAVHPSAVGHQMTAELLAEAIVKTGREVCQGRVYPPQVLPTVGLMVGDPATLAQRNNFIYVKDTIESFGVQDDLKARRASTGFTLYGDFIDRPGWIATNPAGKEVVEFSINLPNKPCYVVYLAVLKSYEKMGTFTVTVVDEKTGKETSTKVDGLWKPRISVPSDFPVTKDDNPECTGQCTVRIITDPIIEGRKGNKVKIMTLSARECIN